MTSFKRWLGAGAIVLVALALVACPALVPKATGSIPAMSFAHDDTTAQTVALGSYFDDSRDATYAATSSAPTVATVSVDNAKDTLTVTPKGAGTTTITVTATSSTGRDSATQTFTVTVASPPPPRVNNAPEMRTISNLILNVGDQVPINLMDYASDADEGDTLVFGADSLNPDIATVSPRGLAIPGSVITITAVSSGQATIAVGVTDGKSAPVTRTFFVGVAAEEPDNRAPVSFSNNVIQDVDETDFRIGDTMMYTLSDHFWDPDQDDLMYEADSEQTSVATVTTPDAETGMFTLEAVGVGNATIVVKATDPDGAEARQTFNVGVGSNPPVLNNVLNLVELQLVADTVVTAMIDLKSYFSDPNDDPLSFMIGDRGDTNVATVTDPDADGMITITAGEAGYTMITVVATATDGDDDPANDSVTLTLRVRVNAIPAAPPTPNSPPMRNDMAAPEVSLVLEDDPSEELDASDYFMDADDDTLTYTAMSSDTGKATVSDPDADGMFTITAVAAGSATITVTASDGKEGDDAELEISVTVSAPTNLAPRLKSGEMLEDLKIEIITNATDPVNTGDDVSGSDTASTGDAADNRMIDLSKYFEDPDGQDSDLAYLVELAKTPEGVIDLHSMAATTAGPATGDPPNGTNSDDTTVWIEPLKVGTTMVTVTALDVLLKKSVPVTFEVEVTAVDSNNPPAVDTNVTFPGADADGNDYRQFAQLTTVAGMFKSTDGPKKLKIDLATLFNDEDVEANQRTTGDSWTFEPVSGDKKIVTVALESTNNNAKPDEYNVVITRVGPGTTTVHFEVTDSFGEKAGDVTGPFFNVRVNNAPKAEGAEDEDPGTLAKLSARYSDLALSTAFSTVTNADGTDNATANVVTLVATGAGYFSDEDAGDTLTCRYDLSGEEIFAATYPSWADAATRVAINLGVDEGTDLAKKGTAHIDVWCMDQAGEASPKARRTIKVTTSGSIQ